LTLKWWTRRNKFRARLQKRALFSEPISPSRVRWELKTNNNQDFSSYGDMVMRIKNENIVNLIEELIDLKIRQALLVKDLSDTATYAQTQVDREAMQKVKLQLVQFLNN
jgi:hypothetical protein